MVGFDYDSFRVDIIDHAVALRDNYRTGIACGDLLHTSSDVRRFSTKKRHGLTLHVRTHQRTVSVIVLEERDKRGGHGHKLFRRDVHVLDVGTIGCDEFTLLAGSISLFDQIPLSIKLNVRLTNDPFVFLPRGKIERIWLEIGYFATFFRYLLIRL